MRDQRQMIRSGLAGGVGLASVLLLAGCMGPTYGTGTPSDQQLLEDVTGIISLGPKEREPINYQPRPELVRPASLEVLPQPQQSAAATSEAWPESPEARLARVRADASVNQEDNQFRADVRGSRELRTAPDWDRAKGLSLNPANVADQRAEFNRRLVASQQGDPNTRRFLSEPPTQYRQPAETAAANDVGEDEWRKQRRAKQARGESGGWRDYVPWL